MEQTSKQHLVAWLGGIVMVAGAAVAALSLGGKADEPVGAPTVVAMTERGGADADAARASRKARLDDMRARLDALADRVDALPDKPAPVREPASKPSKPSKPAKPSKPPVDDDDGPTPVVIDPACLANPLCIKG